MITLEHIFSLISAESILISAESILISAEFIFLSMLEDLIISGGIAVS